MVQQETRASSEVWVKQEVRGEEDEEDEEDEGDQEEEDMEEEEEEEDERTGRRPNSSSQKRCFSAGIHICAARCMSTVIRRCLMLHEV